MAGAVVCDSVIMDNTVIGENSEVTYAIIDNDVTVGKDCKIGASRKNANGIAVIGEDISVPDGTVVKDGAMISKASDLDKEGK